MTLDYQSGDPRILVTSSREQFTAAAHDIRYDGVIMPMTVDDALQSAITEAKKRMGAAGQLDFNISSDIVSLRDDRGICPDTLKIHIEHMGQLYHNMTGYPEIVAQLRPNFTTNQHNHPYPVLNTVVDTVQTQDSPERGTKWWSRHGNRNAHYAPLSALFYFKAYLEHTGERHSPNGLTILVRPTDEYVGRYIIDDGELNF